MNPLQVKTRLMKILIAPDSFKDSLSSVHAAEAIARGFRRAIPEAELCLLPLADGGEGTVATLVSALQGEMAETGVHDPLMRPVTAFFGLVNGGATAVIEMAAASGLEWLKPEERDPWTTTTYGTGELMLAAMDRGCSEILLGIGGSATVDGGTGMAMALGARFLDSQNNPLPPGGGALKDLHRIELSGMDPRLKNTRVQVACDVENPLTGERGAAQVFGPQKGAGPEMVGQLDDNLRHLASRIREFLGIEVNDLPGAGAAGGLGAGLVAFAGAQLVPGFTLISGITRLEDHIAKADLVITGEGKLDASTGMGKTPWGVARLCLKHGKPLVAFAGKLGEGAEKLIGKGFRDVVAITPGNMPLPEALANADQLLEEAAFKAAQGLHPKGTDAGSEV